MSSQFAPSLELWGGDTVEEVCYVTANGRSRRIVGMLPSEHEQLEPFRLEPARTLEEVRLGMEARGVTMSRQAIQAAIARALQRIRESADALTDKDDSWIERLATVAENNADLPGVSLETVTKWVSRETGVPQYKLFRSAEDFNKPATTVQAVWLWMMNYLWAGTFRELLEYAGFTHGLAKGAMSRLELRYPQLIEELKRRARELENAVRDELECAA